MSIELSHVPFENPLFLSHGEDSEVVPSAMKTQYFRRDSSCSVCDNQNLKTIISKVGRFEFALAFILASFCL